MFFKLSIARTMLSFVCHDLEPICDSRMSLKFELCPLLFIGVFRNSPDAGVGRYEMSSSSDSSDRLIGSLSMSVLAKSFSFSAILYFFLGR